MILLARVYADMRGGSIGEGRHVIATYTCVQFVLPTV